MKELSTSSRPTSPSTRTRLSSSSTVVRTTVHMLLLVVQLLLLLLQVPSRGVEATISIVETGQAFDSKPDRRVGQRLWKGYEYMGRLQYLPHNPTLCPPEKTTTTTVGGGGGGSSSSSSNTEESSDDLSEDGLQGQEKYDIIPTSDGLPVALLAATGGCSLAEKALVASTMIDPPNTVQYLIVADYGRRRRPRKPRRGLGETTELDGTTENRDLAEDAFEYYYDYEEESDNDESIFDGMMVLDLEEAREGSTSSKAAATFVGIDRTLKGTDDESYYLAVVQQTPTTEGTVVPSSGDETKVKKEDVLQDGNDNGLIQVAVLHVTYAVGDELFTVISKEPEKTHIAGGMKILLNSKEPGVGARTIVLWLLSTLVMCACACCCMLMFVQTSMEEQQPQAPPRPVRRRLTLLQVRTNFPAFHFDPEVHHQQQQSPESSDEKSDQTDQPTQNTYCQLLDECTICLDEFHPGDRCRQLPCRHIFHSTCIARWLIERSAVCPLCKMDLYEEEEEDDSSNESEDEAEPPSSPTQSLLSWWGDFINRNNSNSTNNQDAPRQPLTGRRSNHTQQQVEVPSGEAATAAAPSETDPTAQARSWWPFSLEIADGTEEYHGNNNDHHDENGGNAAPRRRSRGFGWHLNWFGQRRHWRPHQQTGTVVTDGNMLTELTEPLISGGEGALETSPPEPREQPLEEISFADQSTEVLAEIVAATPDENRAEI